MCWRPTSHNNLLSSYQGHTSRDITVKTIHDKLRYLGDYSIDFGLQIYNRQTYQLYCN